jgi:hypothetical protein
MFERWLFKHDGKTYGPMPMAGVMRLATAGRLLPNDPLWPEDFDSEMAFPASATIDFAALAKLPAKAPPAPRPASAPIPDWLSDVQQSEALDRSAQAPAPSPLDWLNDVEQVELLIRRVKPPPPVPSIPPAPPPPVVPVMPPRAAPAPVAPPRVTPIPPASPPVAPPRVSPPAVAPSRSAPVPAPPAPVAPPGARPAIAAPPIKRPSPQETGYDPDTGQILDPVKFKKWQREQQQLAEQAAASEPGETIYETFRRARNALSAWADLDQNQPLLIRGNMNEVRQDPEVHRMMQSYQAYSHELVRKLWDFLEFLVENRRKFYASRV